MNTMRNLAESVVALLRSWRKKLGDPWPCRIYVGRSPAGVPAGAVIFFPCRPTVLTCGLAGIVAFKKKQKTSPLVNLDEMARTAEIVARHRMADCLAQPGNPADGYLGGDALIGLQTAARGLKNRDNFYAVYADVKKQATVLSVSQRLADTIAADSQLLNEKMGHLDARIVDVMAQRLEQLKDIVWTLSTEVAQNIVQISELMGTDGRRHDPSPDQLAVYKNINTILNSIDRLEVRGRDSAGISLMFILEKTEFAGFKEALARVQLSEEMQARSSRELLVNGGIGIHEIHSDAGPPRVTVALTYKVAAEIGRLGDNVRFIRRQIKEDRLFRLLVTFPHLNHTVSSHTRWASVGAITEANCHPVDNQVLDGSSTDGGIIHVCLNGDIDNYLALKDEHIGSGKKLHKDITTDTKIIPLQVEKYVLQGHPVEEAFRRAVNDFEGSHAISMHTDLAPGKFFLAQRGSGQTVFIGLSADLYMPTSEVYGFVEETAAYLKMDGTKTVAGKYGATQGQIFILDQGSPGGLAGIRATYYDGTAIRLDESDIKRTEITSRDIDRQGYPHYFLKEISEAPHSVEKTLQNRWKIRVENGRKRYAAALDEVVPERLRRALTSGSATGIRRIYFVGQGTAGVAALACADILNFYLNAPGLQVRALKASELSGFTLTDTDDAGSMSDALVIAISQSGTTTDTNRTVAMVRDRGAHTLAIVNRRDSDITFKVDGVMYTSSGRDIEMSVASTKAFYSQIVAGALLGLYIAGLKKRRDADFISDEIKRLLEIPAHMRTVLATRERIRASAERLATQKAHWAVVGSGPNKAAADEIRIKLSELCYKTISTDFVEDKKHIDLSAEPLIIVCAAGTREAVLGDIIKDAAIFKAHKAAPVVIASEGETRFAQYADDVFHVPVVSEHLSPILNTLVGHIWGYYAALSFNEGSRFIYDFQTDLQKTLGDYTAGGLDLYEVLLEKSFREKIVTFYTDFRRRKSQNLFPASMGLRTAANITLLLKYLAGKLPVSDFEIDFGTKGTPSHLLNHLFGALGECINAMARPVDAIKHQAKTVTVGTSRLSERLEGLLFDALVHYGFKASQLTPANIIVLRNLQAITADIKGAICYRIGNLNLLGEPTDETTIHVERKDGVLQPIPSRVETDNQLKGTKRIIVRQGNVYTGKGRKDDRSIVVIPILSTNPGTPNLIEHLLLLNVGFERRVPLAVKIKALGGKYEHIISIVQENSVPWQDDYLERVAMDELFGRSAEKIAEFIVGQVTDRVTASKEGQRVVAGGGAPGRQEVM